MRAPIIRVALLLMILGSGAGSAAPVSIPVTSAIVGGTASFAVSPLAGATYQWKKDGRPLISVGRISGATSPALIISHVGKSDIGTYACDVTKLGTTITHGATFLRFTRKPEVTAPPPVAAAVSHDFVWQLSANDEVSTYSVTGLPPGLACDAKTGRISGRPNAAGPRTIRVTARNAAGTGATRTYGMDVSPMPAKCLGRFWGLVQQTEANEGLGGALDVTITATGAVTGRLFWGALSHSFTGRS